MREIRNGRFLKTMAQVVEWIRDKKRFSYVGPDYIVVGMSQEEYRRLFAQKQRDFNYEVFYDEVSKMTDEQYQALFERLGSPR